MRAFHLSLLKPVINEPLCIFVLLGGNWVWLVALAVPRHSQRKPHIVLISVCEHRGAGSGAGTSPGPASQHSQSHGDASGAGGGERTA